LGAAEPDLRPQEPLVAPDAAALDRDELADARAQLDAWEHPARYDVRWAEHWRFRHPPDQRDPNLATHVVIARTRGVALHGPPPDVVLPGVLAG
jgi:hypothetical protein